MTFTPFFLLSSYTTSLVPGGAGTSTKYSDVRWWGCLAEGCSSGLQVQFHGSLNPQLSGRPYLPGYSSGKRDINCCTSFLNQCTTHRLFWPSTSQLEQDHLLRSDIFLSCATYLHKYKRSQSVTWISLSHFLPWFLGAKENLMPSCDSSACVECSSVDGVVEEMQCNSNSNTFFSVSSPIFMACINMLYLLWMELLLWRLWGSRVAHKLGRLKSISSQHHLVQWSRFRSGLSINCTVASL